MGQNRLLTVLFPSLAGEADGFGRSNLMLSARTVHQMSGHRTEYNSAFFAPRTTLQRLGQALLHVGRAQRSGRHRDRRWLVHDRRDVFFCVDVESPAGLLRTALYRLRES